MTATNLENGSENGNDGSFTKLPRNFELDGELSYEEKIENFQKLIHQLKQAASEIAEELQQAKFEQNDVDSRLRNLYWNCKVYDIKYKKEEIHHFLEVLDGHHQAEMQRKEQLLEVNQLCHKLQHGRKSCAEERRIQKSMKSVDTKKNEKLRTYSATELKCRIPWSLKETVGSKESFKDIVQVVYDELHQLGKRKYIYNKEARHFKKKSEAMEKEIDTLQRKLEYTNSRKMEAHNCMSQLENSSAMSRA